MFVPPSQLLGLTPGSYEAYCLDQAVWYFGSTVNSELEQAGQKKSKGQGRSEAARKRVLAKYLSTGSDPVKQQYADPAALFGL
jgi:hypothetical protein